MKVGIICEYNPLHNGHIYHINKIKEMFSDAKIVLVMSGNFTESGNVSVMNKWDKTKVALEYGVDLVLELPYAFATESADTFALGAVSILNQMDCDYLVFGSESNDISYLTNLANIQLKKNFGAKVKEFMNEGISYPTAVNKALSHFTDVKNLEPNDVLGIAYIREIIKLNSKMIPFTIQRTNEYNDVKANNAIASARSIRKLLVENKDIKDYIPAETYKFLQKECHNNDEYFTLLKYRILTDNDLSIYQTVDEGIENRIKKYISEANNLDDLIMKVKNKRFTYNKLARMFNHILCGYTKKDAKSMKKLEYIRVLGFNKTGQEIIKDRKKKTNVPIINSYHKGYPMLDLEFNVDKIYSINKYDDEYKKKPIIK
jgi:predicted nucleotidyltransferase